MIWTILTHIFWPYFISSNNLLRFAEGKTLQSRVTLETLSLAVTLGFFFCAVSQTLGSYLSISPMLLVSVLAVLAATLFPRTVGTVSASGGVIGVLIMQVMDVVSTKVVCCGVLSCVCDFVLVWFVVLFCVVLCCLFLNFHTFY